MTDYRAQELRDWAGAAISKIDPACKLNSVLQSVSGDASFRRYFRVEAGSQTFIAVDAPPENEDSHHFVRLAELLRASGVSAPEVLGVDYSEGFLLLQDFGDELYLRRLLQAQAAADIDTPRRLYEDAIGSLILIQSRVDKKRLDPYDRTRLRNEMALFEHWFCEKFLKLQLTATDQKCMNDAFTFLEDVALTQPQVAVHRDYHSRNLMILDGERFGSQANPGIIDFQDAVSGAYTYDLVSLLRDCYIRWEPAVVKQWALHYLTLAIQHGVVKAITEKQFFRDFDLMGLQRNLKVMGIFSRLCLRDNKPQFLADIPLVIRYFLEVSQHHSELSPFHHWFLETVLPAARPKLQLDF